MAENVAVLVIHGIGQQKPYETLDQFTRGLVASFAKDHIVSTLQPRLDICKDPLREQRQWVRASCRLDLEAPAAFRSAASSSLSGISFFEYYWAPITQDRITYVGSLIFLIKAGLTPFKYLAANISALSLVGEKKRIPIVILKEIWRLSALFLPLLALLAALLVFVSSTPPSRLVTLYHEFPSDSVLLIAILAVRYLYLWTICVALLGSLRAKGTWQASSLWRLCLVFALACDLFLLPLCISAILSVPAYLARCLAVHAAFLPALLGHWGGVVRKLQAGTLPPYGGGIVAWLNSIVFLKPAFTHYHYLVLPACVLLALFVRFILIDYLGDVAVYVNSDQFSSSFTARAQILDECTRALSEILQQRTDPADAASPYVYDRVLIAGHSLGSVIAYDTLNELLDRARSTDVKDLSSIQPMDLDKLRGMVTFGCPLNKIFYFFREQIPPAEAVRRQLIDLLHSFRVLDPLKTYGGSINQPMALNTDPRWMKAEAALASGFRWINAFALFDPISGRLSFYDLQADENQKIFPYWRPGLAHLQYWGDPNFYAFIRARLL